MNAEQMYKAFIDAGRSVAGLDVPGWGNLPSEEREVWEAVADKARRAHESRFAKTIETTLEQMKGDADDTIVTLRARYGA